MYQDSVDVLRELIRPSVEGRVGFEIKIIHIAALHAPLFPT
jgi:hypothetical protein